MSKKLAQEYLKKAAKIETTVLSNDGKNFELIVKGEFGSMTEKGFSKLQLAQLQGLLKPIIDDIQILKVDVHTLKEDVKVLKQDVEGLKDEVRVLKEDVKILKDDVKVLKADVNVLKDEVKVLKQDVKVLKIDVKILKDDVKILQSFHKDDLELIKK